jgi:hypothetical protein
MMEFVTDDGRIYEVDRANKQARLLNTRDWRPYTRFYRLWPRKRVIVVWGRRKSWKFW